MTSARYIFCSGLSVLYKLIEKILANDFRIAVPFVRESTTHWRISITEGQACGMGLILNMLLISTICWTNSLVDGDLPRMSCSDPMGLIFQVQCPAGGRRTPGTSGLWAPSSRLDAEKPNSRRIYWGKLKVTPNCDKVIAEEIITRKLFCPTISKKPCRD